MGNSTSSIEVIDLDPKDDREAWNVLARAFIDYPVMTFLQPDQVKREKVLAWYMGFTTRVGRKVGRLLTTPDLKGVAVWLPPKACWLSIGQFIAAGAWEMPFRMGFKTYKRDRTNDNFLEKIRRRYAPQEHWYLWAVGVDPAFKNQGIGSALIKPILNEADNDGNVCYLETHLKSNLTWYEKHGFKVVFDGEIPGYSLPVWAMMRQPAMFYRR